MKRRNGHMPGHVRDTFVAAIEAYHDWWYRSRPNGAPLPTVTFEIAYEPTQISIAKACGLVWCCTDILAGSDFELLADDLQLPMRSRTYAAAARSLLADLKKSEAKLEA
jgi:hypothetical protein